MGKIILALSIFLLSACGDNKFEYPLELTSYVHSYEDDKLEHTGITLPNHSIILSFAHLNEEYPNEDWVGVCVIGQGTRKIKIDIDYWYRASEELRTQIIYHEFGHCDLDLGHSQGGIMSSRLNRALYNDPLKVIAAFFQLYLTGIEVFKSNSELHVIGN